MKSNRDLAAAQARLVSITSLNETNSAALEQARVTAQQAGETVASLQQQLREANRRLEEQGDIEKALTDQFKVLATEVIDSNNERFLTTADEKVGNLVQQAKKDFDLSKEAVSGLVKPLSEELKRIETARTDSQGSLRSSWRPWRTATRLLSWRRGTLQLLSNVPKFVAAGERYSSGVWPS